MRQRDLDPETLAACVRRPLGDVAPMLQPEPPHIIDLELLGDLALVLEVDVSELIRSDDSLTMTAGLRPRATPGRGASER